MSFANSSGSGSSRKGTSSASLSTRHLRNGQVDSAQLARIGQLGQGDSAQLARIGHLGQADSAQLARNGHLGQGDSAQLARIGHLGQDDSAQLATSSCVCTEALVEAPLSLDEVSSASSCRIIGSQLTCIFCAIADPRRPNS